jgi:hypothetical protein
LRVKKESAIVKPVTIALLIPLNNREDGKLRSFCIGEEEEIEGTCPPGSLSDRDE